MARMLKLDLHTHPIEALKEKMGIKGILDINKDVAEAIVRSVKSSGLDGIAITEYNHFNFGWVAGLEIMDHFQSENLIILPGSEITFSGQHFLSIYIPLYVRRSVPFFQGKEWYLILAHPGFYQPLDLSQFDGMDFDAVEAGSLLGDFIISGEISRVKKIPIVRSSDAHNLTGFGSHFTEMEADLDRKKHRRH
jgi:hypothetical protein